MLLYATIFILLSNAVTLRRDKSISYSRVATAVLISCFLLCFTSLYIRFIDRGIGLFGGLYNITAISSSFHIFICLVAGVILQLNSFYPRKVWKENFSSLYKLVLCKLVYINTFIINKMASQFKILEYSIIILFVIIGAVFLISSSDLVSLFLSIELQSYGLYILCTIHRNSERATSGGLMYFLLGGLSSCFILLASGLLYGNSGNTGFDGLYIISSISNVNSSAITYAFEWYKSSYLMVSLLILSVGFLFKISAAPFHFWSPDVYDAIPTIVTTFVAIVAKISILILLLELVHYTTNYFFTNNFSWTISLLISSLLSLLVGSILGLTQFRIKRLFAYSTISHIGFILLALVVNTRESIQSFIFYLMQYSISNLNAFILLILIGFSLYFYIEKQPTEQNTHFDPLDKTIETYKETHVSKYVVDNEIMQTDHIRDVVEKNNSPIQLISQIKGYFHVNPVVALSFAITLFSFVGIPPLIGFFAKQMILSSAIDSGYVFMALVAILTSVVSAYYYLALVKQMFFQSTDYILNPSLQNLSIQGNIFSRSSGKLLEKVTIELNNIKLSSSFTITVSVLTLVILLFILAPEHWLSMANILALILFNT